MGHLLASKLFNLEGNGSALESRLYLGEVFFPCEFRQYFGESMLAVS